MSENVGFGNRVRVFAADSSACGSILDLVAGKQTEMMFHLYNDKVIYVLAGKVRLTAIVNGSIGGRDIPAGNTLAIKAGTIHRFEGIENSIVVEFGTFPAAYNDELSDVRIIQKGTPVVVNDPEIAPGDDAMPSIVMTDDDKENLVQEEPVQEKEKEELAKTTKKKTSKRKPRRKKKTD